MKILVAGDSKTTLAIITAILTSLGHEVTTANNGAQTITIYQKNRPDFILLGVVLQDMSGYECVKKIRTIDPNEWIPIIFLSSSDTDNDIYKGIQAGADDYIIKPVSEVKLLAKIFAMQRIADMRNRLFEMTKKLTLLSSTDVLTGLYNRLQFDRFFKEKIAEADRFGQKFALLFIDLDHFKEINDTKGHHLGDLVLKETAKRLKACLRINDVVARLGGDEFAIIINQIDDDNIPGVAASKIISTLSKKFILNEHVCHIGASIGIALYPAMGRSQEELMRHADMAMYRAKTSGRNNFQYFNFQENSNK